MRGLILGVAWAIAVPSWGAGRLAAPQARGHAVMQTMLPNLLATQAGRPLAEAYIAQPIPVTISDFENIPEPSLRSAHAYFMASRPRIRFNSFEYDLTESELSRLETDRTLREEVAFRLEPAAVHELRHWLNATTIASIGVIEEEVMAYDAENDHLAQRLEADPGRFLKVPGSISPTQKRWLKRWGRDPELFLQRVVAAYPHLHSINIPPSVEHLRHMGEDLEMFRQSMSKGEVHGNAEFMEFCMDIAAAAEDQLLFWADPARIARNRDYYAKSWELMMERWRQWRQVPPDNKLPLPTPWGRAKVWLSDFRSVAR